MQIRWARIFGANISRFDKKISCHSKNKFSEYNETVDVRLHICLRTHNASVYSIAAKNAELGGKTKMKISVNP